MNKIQVKEVFDTMNQCSWFGYRIGTHSGFIAISKEQAALLVNSGAAVAVNSATARKLAA
jgi:UDP-N-acetylenolpyruvoylglucosamine reductase